MSAGSYGRPFDAAKQGPPRAGRVRPTLDPAELSAFAAGTETRLHRILGAHLAVSDGIEGTRFTVWAPGAAGVGVMGSFNRWRADRHPMRRVGDTGVWVRFVPGVGPGAGYKFEIRSSQDDPDAPQLVVDKADPMASVAELRPQSASIVAPPAGHPWSDGSWMASRADRTRPGRPISAYEVHAGSWRRNDDGSWLGYRALAEQLLPYVADLGFTHIELMPITEHPYDASWGYQTLGYFALTSRYGPPDDFRAFVDAAHAVGIGVLLDWVPAHFPYDAHGLARFDGGPLYEHADPRRGAHPDWGTAIFDFGRPEVASFLISSARYWLEEFHLDGLRVDAVASMLYLDYSRGPGDWEPNVKGGNENLEAVAFLQRLTETLHVACPGALLCGEESTTWPGVTAPVESGGLGFDMKWNMGWMNDTLRYMETEPARRGEEHHRITFSLLYTHSERHMLPLSHDEVVHLKRSLLSKMPGSDDEKLAQLRLLYGYMWTHPGAKLLFMGGEIGQRTEWSEEGELAWELLEEEGHRRLRDWVRALNGLYRSEPAVHELDEQPAGFEWLDADDRAGSVLTYVRRATTGGGLLVAANFSGSHHPGYPLGPTAGSAHDIALSSDAPEFGGSGTARFTTAPGEGGPPAIDLPPFAFVVLRPRRPLEGAAGPGPADPGAAGGQPA